MLGLKLNHVSKRGPRTEDFKAFSLAHWCLKDMFVILNVYFFNLLMPGQNGWIFAHDIFRLIYLDENLKISINISPYFIRKSQIDSESLVHVKSLLEPMLTQIHVTVWHLYATKSKCILIIYIFKTYPVKLPSGKCNKTPLMISWHFFR